MAYNNTRSQLLHEMKVINFHNQKFICVICLVYTVFMVYKVHGESHALKGNAEKLISVHTIPC